MTSGAGGSDVEFGPDWLYPHRSSRDAASLSQERRLALVRFDEIELDPGCQSDHQSGQAGSGTEIDRAGDPGRKQVNQLQGVEDVPFP